MFASGPNFIAIIAKMGRVMSNIFVSGGTLGADAPSYIERRADHQLYRALMDGEFAYVLDSRQKGKSSLMIRTREALEKAGVQTVLLDLQRFGANIDVERWYASLLLMVGQSIQMEDRLLDHWEDQKLAGPMNKFFSAVEFGAKELGRPIVIFVDEIDFVRSLPFSTDEFFSGIREVFNRRAAGGPTNLTFCLLGVATPSELIQDVQITPFNIGQRVELTDFTLPELAPFAGALSSDNRNGEALVKRIHHWTGGHPYLTQKLASAVAADLSIRNPSSVDRLVETIFFSNKARAEEPNLSDVSRRVLESRPDGLSPEETRARTLDLYQRVRKGTRIQDDESDPIASVLKLSGLVRILEGYLVVRNRVYFRTFDHAWIQANLPGAELERQKRAAREATVRVGILAGAIGIVIAGLGLFGFYQANEARSRLAERDRALAAANSESLAKDRALGERDDAVKSAQSEAKAKSAALANLQVEQKKTTEALKLAEKNALEAKAQTGIAQSAAKVAERRRLETARQTTLAKANAAKAVAQKQIAEGKTAEALRNLKLAQKLTYFSNIQSMQMSIANGRWDLAAKTFHESSVQTSEHKGWEYRYFDYLFNQHFLELENVDEFLLIRERGEVLVSSNKGGQVSLFDIDSGRMKRTYPGLRDRLCAMSLLQNSQFFLEAEFNSEDVAVINFATGKTEWSVKSEGRETPNRFVSRNGRYFGVEGDEVRMFDFEKREEIPIPRQATIIDISHDEKYFSYSLDDNVVKVCETKTTREITTFTLSSLNILPKDDYSLEGYWLSSSKLLFVYSGNSLSLPTTYCVFDIEKNLETFRKKGSGWDLRNNGQSLVKRTNSDIEVVDLLTGSRSSFYGVQKPFDNPDISRDGKHVMEAADTLGMLIGSTNSYNIPNTSMHTIQFRRYVRGNKGPIYSYEVGPANELLCTLDDNGSLRFFKEATENPELTFRSHGYLANEFSSRWMFLPMDKTLWLNSDMTLFEVFTGKEAKSLEVSCTTLSRDGRLGISQKDGRGSRAFSCIDLRTGESLWGGSSVQPPSFSPDGNFCVYFVDGLYRLVNAANGATILSSKSPNIPRVRWSTDSEYLVIGNGRNDAFTVISVPRRKVLYSRKLKENMGSSLTRDNELLFADAKGRVFCVQLSTGKTSWTFDTGLSGTMLPLLSPDRRTLAAHVEEGIFIHDFAHRKRIAKVVTVSEGSMRFTPDGEYLVVSGSEEATLCDLETGVTVFRWTGNFALQPVFSDDMEVAVYSEIASESEGWGELVKVMRAPHNWRRPITVNADGTPYKP